MSASKLISIFFESTPILGSIAASILKLRTFVSVKTNKKSDTINEVLFYGPDEDEQKQLVGLNNLFCIYYVIVHASLTVDVCVPTLESETISKCLLSVHQKNHIKVRIVIHAGCDSKYFNEFVDCGVEIKFIKSGVKLEHEFLLIDANCNDAMAIIGSLDYEVNRVNYNRDTTILSSEKNLIYSLKQEFERIWNTNNVE